MKNTVISKKVCVLGDFAVGKTSLIRRFVYDLFDDKYISTIGVKVSRKQIVVPAKETIIDLGMMLWDLAGNEEWNQVRSSYMRGAAGAILVCDLTRPETLHNIQSYVDNFISVNPDAYMVLAANKIDQTDQRRLTSEQIESFAGQLKTLFYYTSAKTGEQVEEIFRQLGRNLVTNYL